MARSSPRASCPLAEAAPAGTRGEYRDLKLNGNEETFTITVTYDTQELYGTVIGSRQFTIYRD